MSSGLPKRLSAKGLCGHKPYTQYEKSRTGKGMREYEGDRIKWAHHLSGEVTLMRQERKR
jgi:hypothetical protein